MSEPPIWTTWADTIPMRPLAADVFANGVYRRPRDEALQCAHIEFNTASRVGWLLFDNDTATSFESWERADLPAPNFYAQNGSNGHGHLAYALRTPVSLLGASRERPIALAADVQRGMTQRLGADPAYANRLAKNPISARWRSSWLVAKPYDLRQLLDALDRRDLTWPTTRAEVTGISRNCDLFNELRQHAYSNVRSFKRVNGRADAWREQLHQQALAINLRFGTPLSFAEVRQIAKSVARWTWGRFSDERFSQIQARRGVVSGQRRAQAAAAAADAVVAMIRQ